MRVFAIAANLVQMGILLAIFLTKGLALGGMIILALFILLIIALINLLVLLFYAVNTAAHQSLVGGDKAPVAKRQDLRVTYALGPQPMLSLDGQRYAVMDISERGVRFIIERGGRLKKRLRGKITLLNGETLAVRGSLIRREGNEATLALKTLIDYNTLLKEKQAVGRR